MSEQSADGTVLPFDIAVVLASVFHVLVSAMISVAQPPHATRSIFTVFVAWLIVVLVLYLWGEKIGIGGANAN